MRRWSAEHFLLLSPNELGWAVSVGSMLSGRTESPDRSTLPRVSEDVAEDRQLMRAIADGETLCASGPEAAEWGMGGLLQIVGRFLLRDPDVMAWVVMGETSQEMKMDSVD